MNPKYPEIEVQLSEQDGNAFSIIARVTKAMKRAKIPDSEQSAFREEAMSGDYDNVLQTCMKWVNVT